MPTAITDWRTARSFIGLGVVSSVESVELDFNIGTQEAIEISGIQGGLQPFSVVSAATIVPLIMQQSIHVEDGTLETLSIDATDADQFDNDSEVIFEQRAGLIAFDGTTEGGAALEGFNKSYKFARPIISPINLTHRGENNGACTGIAVVIIEYRYVRLSTQELAFQFARRRR